MALPVKPLKKQVQSLGEALGLLKNDAGQYQIPPDDSGYFSSLQEAIVNSRNPSMRVDQAIGTFSKNHAQEMEETGLMSHLKSMNPQDKITQRELFDVTFSNPTNELGAEIKQADKGFKKITELPAPRIQAFPTGNARPSAMDELRMFHGSGDDQATLALRNEYIDFVRSNPQYADHADMLESMFNNYGRNSGSLEDTAGRAARAAELAPYDMSPTDYLRARAYNEGAMDPNRVYNIEAPPELGGGIASSIRGNNRMGYSIDNQGGHYSTPQEALLGVNNQLRMEAKGNTRWNKYTQGEDLPEGYVEDIVTNPFQGGVRYEAGQHWDDLANPLFHTRTSIRKTADDQDVLFLEELQSDWHQAGQKYGYREESKLPPEDVMRLQDIDAEIDAIRRETPMSPNASTRQERIDALKEEAEVLMRPSADAPFKKNEWEMAGLKRAIMRAAQEDLDGIAIPSAVDVRNLYGAEADKYMEAYKNVYEKRMLKNLKKLGKRYGVEPRLEKIDYGDGEFQERLFLPITEDMRKEILKRGMQKYGKNDGLMGALEQMYA
jgi:hypothetical protein